VSRDSIDLDIAAPPAVLDPRFPLARREIIALMETLLATLGLSAAHLSLTLVDDAGIARAEHPAPGLPGPHQHPELSRGGPGAAGRTPRTP